jgi:putative acetyltransferase
VLTDRRSESAPDENGSGAKFSLSTNWLNLTRLELEVYTDNEPAIRLYEAFGFEREGRLRQHAFSEGRYVASYVMGRLRPQGGER